MAESELPTDRTGAEPPQAVKLPPGWLSKWPWLTFLLPFAVFMLATSFEPSPPEPTEADNAASDAAPLDTSSELELEPRSSGWLPEFSYDQYPLVYSAKIALVALAMLLVLPGYRTFAWRVSPLAIVVGVVGVVIWIGLCHLRLELAVIEPVDLALAEWLSPPEEPQTTIGLSALFGAGHRSAFKPLVELKENPAWAFAFLAIRFLGLAVIVPVIEEFFLRGFLMRYVIQPNWWQIPFGEVNATAVVVGTAVPMLMHPGELLAALVWFSMVTWLMVRTKNIWDCVVAHGVTNFLLGVYVVTTDNWQLM